MEQLREEMDEMKEQMGHLMLEMRDLVRNQDALKEENSQLKTQLSLVMEVLKTVLRKEGDAVPAAATEVIDSLFPIGFLSTHGMPQGALPQFQVPLPPHQSVHVPRMNQGAKCVGKSLRYLREFSILSRCLTLSYFPVCWSFSWLSYENWLRLKSFPPPLMPMLDVSSILGHLVMILRIVGR